MAQSGDGSLRGLVKDEQGAVMPGATVTATSPALLTPAASTCEADGSYRLSNLPPGTYTLTAELSGSRSVRKESILLRAGANFQVDFVLAVGSITETITVTGESPMLEVTKPSNVLTIDASFQKEVPVVQSHFWSDFLQYTPGVPRTIGSMRAVSSCM